MTNPNLDKKQILDFLGKHQLMALATFGNHPWIASVYFSFDENLNLYFLSSPDTLHARIIECNPKVAVAIADSHQTPNERKRGLQLWGVATKINNLNKFRHALSQWKSALSINNPELTFQNIQKGIISGQMYQVTPKKIKLFDQELFADTPDGEEPTLEL